MEHQQERDEGWLIELVENHLPRHKKGKKEGQIKSLPWIKLHRDWWKTDSHIGLDGVDLGCGAAIMCLINSMPCPVDDSGEAFLVSRVGHILTVADFARETRFTRRQVNRAVKRLVKCNTFRATKVYDSVIVSVCNFRKWQTTPEHVKKAKSDEAFANALGVLGPNYVDGFCESKGLKLVPDR